MRSRFRILTCVLAATGLAACGDEDPVGLVGWLPDGAVRTIQVVLEAPEFLAWDSARAGYTRPTSAQHLVVAEDFGGALDSHVLLRFATLPKTVRYDSAGTKIDTLPAFVGGEVVARVDTAATRAPGPVTLILFRTAEDWDARSATWTMRVDTGAVDLLWTEDGGTRAEQLGTASYTPGDTILRIPVDSQAVAMLGDTLAPSRGALLVAETPGARIHINSARLRLRARPSAKPDTIVDDSVSLVAGTFIYTPNAVNDGSILVGGSPAWRSFLRLKERLDTLSVPCPDEPEGCRLRLSDATLNFAGLQLQPVGAPPGLIPTSPLIVDARVALAPEGVPIARSPVSERVGGTTVDPAAVDGGAAEGRIEVPITAVIRGLLTPPGADEDRQPTTLALLGMTDFSNSQVFEGGQIGVISFGSATSGDAAPRLRLILSVTSEVRLR
jgi:hypothetical protein